MCSGAVAAIDMDSYIVIRVAKHRNIVETKQTNVDTGKFKLTRAVSATNAYTTNVKENRFIAF